MHVVAARLPEAGRVAQHELQAGDPLRALPEVEPRDDQADREAVIPRQWLALVGGGQDDVVCEEVVERQVSREVGASALVSMGI